MLHRLDSISRLFSQHEPTEVEQSTFWLLKEQRFSFIFASFSAAKCFRPPKIFGMVKYNLWLLFKYGKGPFAQRVTSNRASKCINTVSRLPKLKMFLRTRPCWPKFCGNFLRQNFCCQLAPWSMEVFHRCTSWTWTYRRLEKKFSEEVTKLCEKIEKTTHTGTKGNYHRSFCPLEA